MVAGLEPMSRGAIKGVDLVLCVVEPSKKALDVALEIYRLSKDLGVKRFAIIGNKIMSEEDRELIESKLKNLEILEYVPYDENIVKADKLGVSVIDYNPNAPSINALKVIKNKICDMIY